ncbi:MAG: leucyl/phenylalanyl-tRNA--protein transferase [Hyphomicrobiaceae bacterium]|nr:leucyl/phenylalanyl-tRNA--protein transferase [Hyphomicrobiaceae bacterium]
MQLRSAELAIEGGAKASSPGALRNRESLPAVLKRAALSTAFDLKPPRHRAAPRLAYLLVRHLLSGAPARHVLPDPCAALPGREGVAGFCDDMSVATLLRAYARGLYPCTHFGPVRWNAPPLRAVLEISELKLRDELRRKLKKRPFRITFDRDPRRVMLACAAPRAGQWPLTWITPDVVEAYLALFDVGHMHSVEAYDAAGELVGGLFGTVAGRCFVVESLFHTRDNSSKYALAVLVGHLQAWGFTHVDNKLQNSHCAALGFREIPRATYVALLDQPTPASHAGVRWAVDPALDLARWTPAAGPPPRRAAEPA